MRPMLRRLAAFLLLAALVAPLGARPVARAAQEAPPEPAPEAAVLAPVFEAEGAGTLNDTPQTARPIGAANEQSWSQVVQGTIGSAGDVDYFRFTLTQPASSVSLELSGLVADYDLVLAGDPAADQGFDPGQPGLDDVAQVGGTINAIGGTINAIGGTINAIGGTINAISANSGSAPEAIQTFLWLPGDYYAVVAANNGDFGDTRYTLNVLVEGSGLTAPPPAPEVELRVARPPQALASITTLYIVAPERMRQLYPLTRTDPVNSPAISTTIDLISTLISNPPNPNGAGPEYGVMLDLGTLIRRSDSAKAMAGFYAAWDSKASNPLAANYVARVIKNVIEAAVTDGVSGAGASAGHYLGSIGNPPISFPNVRNIVLVGGDNVIPGFRLPDLTTIANEADYLAYLRDIDPSGVIDSASPQGAALRYRMITSDNPYAMGRPYSFYGFPFYLPRLAVGRLVETPFGIASYLDAYTFNGSLNAPSFNINLEGILNEPRPQAFVSGYDFLKDQAVAISDTLGDAGLAGGDVSTLINDSWTRSDLEREWFEGALDSELSATKPNTATNLSRLSLFSVNAHFDHWQVLPAKDSAGNFPAQRLLAPTYVPDGNDPNVPGAYFRTTLGYSVGCHSGYNIIGKAILPATANASLYEADFAQAMNRHGGNWIGNTGYGYGTADGIDYTERLATLYTEELARNVQGGSPTAYVGQSIGAALRNAKQRYVRNSTSLTAYDFKATHIMTLYGLPYIRVSVGPNPLDPPEEDPRPNATVPLETQAPYPPSSLGRLTRTITFEVDLNDPDDRTTIVRTGSTVLNLDESDFTITDEFVVRGGGSFPEPGVRTFDNNQIGAPTLPTFAYDISASSHVNAGERLRVKDVIFLGGVYGQEAGFNPQITQVATETLAPIVATAAEPDFDAGVGIWYPDKFFTFSSVGEDELQRDQLLAAAAQFRAGPDGQTGLMRPYSRMVFQVIYDDPGQTGGAADTVRLDDQPPIIESVQIEIQPGAGGQLAQAGQAVVRVKAFDDGPDPNGGSNSGIDPGDISAVYVRDGVNWQNIGFAQKGPGLFAATLPVAQGAVRVIVRVTDRAGNTSYYTAKGSFQPPTNRTLVRLPIVRR